MPRAPQALHSRVRRAGPGGPKLHKAAKPPPALPPLHSSGFLDPGAFPNNATYPRSRPVLSDPYALPPSHVWTVCSKALEPHSEPARPHPGTAPFAKRHKVPPLL